MYNKNQAKGYYIRMQTPMVSVLFNDCKMSPSVTEAEERFWKEGKKRDSLGLQDVCPEMMLHMACWSQNYC